MDSTDQVDSIDPMDAEHDPSPPTPVANTSAHRDPPRYPLSHRLSQPQDTIFCAPSTNQNFNFTFHINRQMFLSMWDHGHSILYYLKRSILREFRWWNTTVPDEVHIAEIHVSWPWVDPDFLPGGNAFMGPARATDGPRYTSLPDDNTRCLMLLDLALRDSPRSHLYFVLYGPPGSVIYSCTSSGFNAGEGEVSLGVEQRYSTWTPDLNGGGARSGDPGVLQAQSVDHQTADQQGILLPDADGATGTTIQAATQGASDANPNLAEHPSTAATVPQQDHFVNDSSSRSEPTTHPSMTSQQDVDDAAQQQQGSGRRYVRRRVTKKLKSFVRQMWRPGFDG